MEQICMKDRISDKQEAHTPGADLETIAPMKTSINESSLGKQLDSGGCGESGGGSRRRCANAEGSGDVRMCAMGQKSEGLESARHVYVRWFG